MTLWPQWLAIGVKGEGGYGVKGLGSEGGGMKEVKGVGRVRGWGRAWGGRLEG